MGRHGTYFERRLWPVLHLIKHKSSEELKFLYARNPPCISYRTNICLDIFHRIRGLPQGDGMMYPVMNTIPSYLRAIGPMMRWLSEKDKG